MHSITLFLQNNRILRIVNLKELTIDYYRAYHLYGLFYVDDLQSHELIYSSENFFQLLKIEKKIAEAYNNGNETLSLK